MIHTQHRHFFVPAEVEESLTADDLAYLERKDCFSLPTESRLLIKAYFLFVHPSFPILDGPALCQDCADGRLDRINLLLLWSIFSVAASYVPGYAQHSVKKSFVEKATLLFHITHQNDKMLLVQSALLLSFWFAEAEDVKQSWYWTGTAFSIAQTLGLHLEFHGASVHEQTVRRNLWRACLIRDVWLSFGMGRPLRLNSADCSVPLTPTSDYQFHEIVMFDDDKPLYSDAEQTEFFVMWQRLVQLSSSLRAILSKDSNTSLALGKITQSHVGDSRSNESTLALTIVKRHFKLHQCATRIAYYQRQHDAESARDAAAETTSALRAFLVDESIYYVAPVAIPLIVPAILVLLADSKSGHTQVVGSTSGDIDTYIQFLKATESNYPAAAILKRLVVAAQEWTGDTP